MSRDTEIDGFALALLGALDGGELAAARARLDARRVEDVETIAAAEALVGAIGASAPRVTPSPAARERLLLRIAHDAPEVRSRAGSASALPPRPAVRAAPTPAARWIVPAVIGAAFLALALFNALRDAGPSMSSAESEMTRLSLDPSSLRWIVKDLRGPSAAPFAVVVGDAKQKRFFFASDRLPPPPKGRSYVLWTTSKEPNAVPKNVASVRNSSEARVILEVDDVPSLGELGSVTVSVETDATVTTPTEIVAQGTTPPGG